MDFRTVLRAPVAADHVARPDGFDLSFMRRVEALDPCGHRIAIVIGCGPVDFQILQPTRVVRFQHGRGIAHQIEIEIVHPRLIQNNVRKFRQAVLGVLHAPAADDGFTGLVRFPECRLIDPAGLFQHTLAEPEGLKHFHRAASNAVGLAAKQGTHFLLDDAGPDLGKSRQLRRQGQAGWPAPHNEHVNLRWDGSRSS